MNKSILTVACVILGSAIGYYVAVLSRCTGVMFALQILSGAFFGYFIGLALFWKKYGVFIWGFVSLIIVTLVDWAVGSSWTMYGKLEFMMAGLLIGWDFWYFRKRLALLGVIGAICGFVMGMNNRVWFGTVRLDPGLLTATLLAMKFSIAGMGFGSLLFEIFGWRLAGDGVET